MEKMNKSRHNNKNPSVPYITSETTHVCVNVLNGYYISKISVFLHGSLMEEMDNEKSQHENAICHF